MYLVGVDPCVRPLFYWLYWFDWSAYVELWRTKTRCSLGVRGPAATKMNESKRADTWVRPYIC